MARLNAAANQIADKTLADEYRRTFRDRFYAERRQGKSNQGKSYQGKPGKFGKPEHAHASGPVVRPVPSTESSDSERLRILTAILLRHPVLLEDVETSYARLTLDGRLERVRQAIREWADRADVLDSEGVMDHLHTSGLQADVAYVLASVPVPLPACASPSAILAEAGAGWWHIFGFLNVEQLRAEVEAARGDFDREMTRENLDRLNARVQGLLKVQRGDPDGVDLEAA
jgi:DNA primase